MSRSLIFSTVLVWKHFNFLARPYAHFLIVIMYVEVKFQKMPPNFWSKIPVESRDSRFDVVEATQEGIVLEMMEQRNH